MMSCMLMVSQIGRYNETQGTTWCYLADSEDHPNMPLYFFFNYNDVIFTIVAGDIGYYY